MDSAVVLAAGRAAGFEPHALTVRYGQRHACELEAAERVCRAAGVADHRVVDVDLSALAGSALTGGGPVPKDRPAEAIGEGVPEYEVALATMSAGMRRAAELLEAHYDDPLMSPGY